MVFDLDHTLWPFGVDAFHFKPPYHRREEQIYDSQNKPMNCFPEVPQLLRRLDGEGIHLAVASRTTYPVGAHSLIDLFRWTQYIKHREIFPGSKLKHFDHLKSKSGFDFKEMLFFDDETRNITEIQALGVLSILIDRDIGLTGRIVNESLKAFQSNNISNH
jgi:magnesium-dependent phosphatase 1